MATWTYPDLTLPVAVSTNNVATATVSTVNNPLTAVGDFTISVWAKRNATGSVLQLRGTMLEKLGIGLGISNGTTMTTAGTTLIVTLDGAATTFFSTGKTWNDTNWHHFVLMRSGGTISVYMDNSIGTTSVIVPVLSANNGFVLGSRGGALNNIAHSQAIVWDRALTVGEIAEIYNAGLGRILTPSYVFVASGTPVSTNLQILWSLTENTGTTAVDQSANGWNGTLTATEIWVAGPSIRTIQATMGLANVVNGDTIEFTAGTYQLDTTLTISKQLTLKAAVPGTFPNIKLNFGQFTYGINWSTSNITLDGLDIDNTRSGNNNFGYMHQVGAISNLTIKNCKIHHIRRIILDGGTIDGFTFHDNEMYNFLYTPLEIGGASKNISVKRNWFYNGNNATSTGEGAITYFCGNDIGTSEISHNYINSRYGIAINAAVSTAATIGSLDIHHNTIDIGMTTPNHYPARCTITDYSRTLTVVTVNTDVPHGLAVGQSASLGNTASFGGQSLNTTANVTATPSPTSFTITSGSGTYATQIPVSKAYVMPNYTLGTNNYQCRNGMSWDNYSSATNRLNAAVIQCRDNILSRMMQYGMFLSSSQTFNGPIRMNNNLFHDNGWFYWPQGAGWVAGAPFGGTRFTQEEFGFVNGRKASRVPAWDSRHKAHDMRVPSPRYFRPLAAGGNIADKDFIDMSNTVCANPHYALAGATAKLYYALKGGSPALGTATDGTNIGAWQGP